MVEKYERIKKVKSGLVDAREPKTMKLKSSLARKHSV
jgi:hypothetical protein